MLLLCALQDSLKGELPNGINSEEFIPSLCWVWFSIVTETLHKPDDLKNFYRPDRALQECVKGALKEFGISNGVIAQNDEHINAQLKAARKELTNWRRRLQGTIDTHH